MTTFNALGRAAGVFAAVPVLLMALPVTASDVSRANISITTAAAGGGAQSQAGGTYRLRARVPVACWVRSDQTLLASADSTGEVIEACNNPGGFTVTAHYRPLKADEAANLVYDGRSIDLGKGGAQTLRRSSMATIKRVAYRFEQVVLDEPLVLSLTIQPI